MGYNGKTFLINCSIGGWCTNPNYDTLPPQMMEDITNINIHLGGRTIRGSTQKVNSTPITDSPRIMGIYQFVKKNGNSYILTATADGKIYSNYTTLLKDSLSTNKVTTFETFNDKVYICNGANIPQTWNGTDASTSNLGSAGETPPVAPTVALGSGAGNVDNGTHSYKITFVNVHGETSGGTTSAVITVVDKTVNGKIELTAIPTGPIGVTSRKIYRTITGDTGNHKLVTTLSNNTATTYTDNTADASLGANVPTTNTALLIPSDWTGTNYPKKMIKHGKGASERLWAISCPTNPTRIYISGNGTDNFSDAVVIQLNIETGDGFGIIEAVEFGDRLICFGKQKSYIMDDQDLSTTNWGYFDAQWVGGVGALRLAVETSNDIIMMSEDGDIYSIKVAESYGDYTAASLIRPAFLHQWITDNVDLSMINDFHMVYDPDLKAVRIFVARKGQSQVDTCMVFFMERGTSDGWTKHNNLINPSGFGASCSTVVRVGAGEYKVYTGSYNGFVWKLEQSAANDDAKYFYAGFLTIPLIVDTPRGTKNFHTGWIVIRPQGSETININVFIDKEVITEYAYFVTETGDFIVTDTGDNILLTTSETPVGQGTWIVVADNTKDIQNLNYRLGRNGQRIQFECYNNAKDENFFINELMVDYCPLSARFT